MKKKLTLLMILCSVFSCSATTADPNGYLDFSVPGGKSTFSDSDLPSTIKKINLTVSGEKLSVAKNITFDKANPTFTLIVPPGKKKIEAKALDITGKEIASKVEEIVIRAAVRYEIALNLKPPTAEAAPVVSLSVEKQIHPETKDPKRKPVSVGVEISVESGQ